MILLAGLATVIYSAAVMWTVAMSGDVGLRCVFGNRVVDRVSGDWVQNQNDGQVQPALRVSWAPGDLWTQGPPEIGDPIQALGSWTVKNYHDYVQAQRGISRKVGEFVEIRWLDSQNRGHVGRVRIESAPPSSYFWSLIWFVQEMVVFVVGARVYWKRPRDDSARVFFWLCVVTVGAFLGGYHWTRILVNPPLIYLFVLFAVFVPILSLRFYLVFPRTNPLYAAYRRASDLSLIGVPAAACLSIWACMAWAAADTDQARVKQALVVLSSISLGYIRISLLIFGACLACLVYSFVRARTRWERNQVRWILLAALISLFPIAYLMWDTWNAPYRLGLSQSVWPMFVVSLLYTAAYAVSITRYKLMRAEEYLNRGVLYVLISVSAGLLYSGGLVLAALAIGDRLRTERTSIGAMVAGLTAIVVLLLSEVARQGFQRVLDRQFYREKYKFDQAMKRMSQVVGGLVDRSTLSRRLLEAAVEVLRVEWGAIYVDDDDPAGRLELAACHGPQPDERFLPPDNPLVIRLRQRMVPLRSQHAMARRSDPATDAMIALGGEVVAPLVSEGKLAGLLLLGPKRSGMPYDDEEAAFLGALSSVATLALRSAGIQDALEALNRELRDKVEKISEQSHRIVVLQNQLARRPSKEEGDGSGQTGVEVETLKAQDAFDGIKGSSRSVLKMVQVARKVAASGAAVLIRGESGTGKELLAEAMHRASNRSAKAFVKVHCAALSQNLLESELFGHVKGAFTGADRDRVGRFQQADGGTLFLDEIGDINWEVQTKLLRVLQEMAFERVGSSQTITSDVRILAATHQDLEGLIQSGHFREDLYYRLNVISISVPALRERREDIFELAFHLLTEHARKAGKDVTHMDDAAVEALSRHDWPGNIRELENAIERAVVLAEGSTITLDDLPLEVRHPALGRRRRPRSMVSLSRNTLGRSEIPPAPTTSGGNPGPLENEGLPDPLEDDPEFQAYERQRLVDALQEAGGNKSRAARLLALPRSTFFSKLKKHGLA